MGKTDFCGIKHLCCSVVLIAQKYNAAVRKMLFQLLGIVSCYDRDFCNARLMEGVDHMLRNGNGADIQHGFKCTHAGR